MFPVTKDFLGKEAPAGYVAGLARGATGFTTRSDIGPARESSSKNNKEEQGDVENESRGEDVNDDDDERGLFNNAPYEADDEEADKIWADIERKMEERHRPKQTPTDGTTEEDKDVANKEFKGLKRQLEEVTEDEWAAIPDVQQLAESAARAKRRRKTAVSRRGERFAQVSDSTLVASLGAAGAMDEYDQSIGSDTDFLAMGQARDDVLRLRLDQQAAHDSTSGFTTIDPRGYLTSLESLGGKVGEVGDIARARTLLKSVIQTNPKHAPGWIAIVRLEEIAKKKSKARSLIAEACEKCPQSEDVWLEAARLNSRDHARAILASAVRNISRSIRIWQAAAALEAQANDIGAQRRVLRRALEYIPTSAALWKEAVSLEDDPADARVLLAHAVEMVPLSIELWLALAKLETYSSAQKVLNRARRAIPNSHDIWIAAARLEEQSGDQARIKMIMTKAVASLAQHGSSLDRDAWFDQAFLCEQDGYPVTCAAIAEAAAELGFEALQEDGDDEKVDVWIAEADRLASKNGLETSRTLYKLALQLQPNREDLWQGAAELEQSHGHSAEPILLQAVEKCPEAEVLWLMAAKYLWVQKNDVDGARSLLQKASKTNPKSESVLLAAVKLESETQHIPQALKLLEKARKQHQSDSARVWMKSAVLLRQSGQLKEARDLAHKATERFKGFYKLWLIHIQLDIQMGGLETAKHTLSKSALKHCPRRVELWTLAADLELPDNISRARAILERARVYIPRSPQLWLASVRLEAQNSLPAARSLLSRALQECPKSGILWAESILLADRPQRKAKSVDALKHASSEDPAVLVMVARLFVSEQKMEKARAWLERATVADPDCGDAWAWRYWYSSDSEAEAAIDGCVKAEPHHGQIWPRIAKDPANAGCSVKDILLKTVEALDNERQL